METSTVTFYDPDGRLFRIKFNKKEDGSFKAYLETCPWPQSSIDAYSEQETHLNSKYHICLAKTPIYDFGVIKKRADFWCTGFSFLMEHGYTETKAAIPEW